MQAIIYALICVGVVCALGALFGLLWAAAVRLRVLAAMVRGIGLAFNRGDRMAVDLSGVHCDPDIPKEHPRVISADRIAAYRKRRAAR